MQACANRCGRPSAAVCTACKKDVSRLEERLKSTGAAALLRRRHRFEGPPAGRRARPPGARRGSGRLRRARPRTAALRCGQPRRPRPRAPAPRRAGAEVTKIAARRRTRSSRAGGAALCFIADGSALHFCPCAGGRGVLSQNRRGRADDQLSSGGRIAATRSRPAPRQGGRAPGGGRLSWRNRSRLRGRHPAGAGRAAKLEEAERKVELLRRTIASPPSARRRDTQIDREESPRVGWYRWPAQEDSSSFDERRETREMLRWPRAGGYEVTQAATAAPHFHLHVDRPDLILLDVMMSWIDGFELCRAVKRTKVPRHPGDLISARRPPATSHRARGRRGRTTSPSPSTGAPARAHPGAHRFRRRRDGHER